MKSSPPQGQRADPASVLRKTRQGGFTIIELLIVIAIIALLASVALVPLMRARESGHESAALQALSALRGAEIQYKTRYGTYGDLNSLKANGASSVGEGAMEPTSGYTMRSQVGSDSFTIIAVPPKATLNAFTLTEAGIGNIH